MVSNKRVVLLFCTLLSGIVSGMDGSRSTSLLESLIVGEEICPQLSLLSKDIKKEIAKHMLGEKELWYLDKVIDLSNGVRNVYYSPSGKQFAAKAWDKKVGIFDATTRKKIASFAHGGAVDSVCYSPSGKQLATGAQDRKARIFDMETQKEIASFAHGGAVGSVCYSPSEKQLATGSGDGKARIFDIETQKEIASFTHGEAVFSVCYSRLGDQLATASLDYKIHIFDIKTQREIISFAQDDVVISVFYFPSGRQLAAESLNGKTCIYSRYDGYTLEQILLKKMLFTWLLIEKPNKAIYASELLLADVAAKNKVDLEEIVRIWLSFPEKLRSAIWRTMQHKIKQYGKW